MGHLDRLMSLSRTRRNVWGETVDRRWIGRGHKDQFPSMRRLRSITSCQRWHDSAAIFVRSTAQCTANASITFCSRNQRQSDFWWPLTIWKLESVPCMLTDAHGTCPLTKVEGSVGPLFVIKVIRIVTWLNYPNGIVLPARLGLRRVSDNRRSVGGEPIAHIRVTRHARARCEP